MKIADQRLADAHRLLHPSSEAIPHNQTLVLSEDGTYPGIVLRVTETGIHIRWYKWGYAGETFTGWLTSEQLAAMRLTIEECRKRFGGLPPEYQG